MGKFKVGDTARLNNENEVTITSWPAELPGVFAYEYTNRQGGTVTGTDWYGETAEGEPLSNGVHLEFVHAGEPRKSTLPPLNDDIISGHEATATGPAELTVPADPLRDERVEQGDEPSIEPLAEDSGYPGVPEELG